MGFQNVFLFHHVLEIATKQEAATDKSIQPAERHSSCWTNSSAYVKNAPGSPEWNDEAAYSACRDVYNLYP